MAFDSDKNRRSIRWAGYDYAQGGAYFVTICAYQRQCVFGRVLDGTMHLNIYGEMVDEMWRAVPDHFSNVMLDAWQIMPNHVHGIIVITSNVDASVGARHASPLHGPCGAPPNSLGAIIGSFKSAATKRINGYRIENNLAPVKVWQRNYFERVIRHEKELNDMRCYIIESR